MTAPDRAGGWRLVLTVAWPGARILVQGAGLHPRQLAAGYPQLACQTLAIFIFQVQAQTPRPIPAATAARLIAAATQIRAVLGCTDVLF